MKKMKAKSYLDGVLSLASDGTAVLYSTEVWDPCIPNLQSM